MTHHSMIKGIMKRKIISQNSYKIFSDFLSNFFCFCETLHNFTSENLSNETNVKDLFRTHVDMWIYRTKSNQVRSH